MISTYSLIPITILTVVAYFLTFLLSRFGLLRKATHRRLWNVVLLITFLVSGLLGLLLVVQINYALNIPMLDTIMQWHVEFGIAMTLVALFHISWHIRYFKRIFTTYEKTSQCDDNQQITSKREAAEYFRLRKIRNRLKFAVVALGVTAIITQVVLLREFLSVFYGNELVIGIILGNWMFLTGLGSFMGKVSHRIKNKVRLIIILLMVISIMPVLTVFSLDYLRNIIFPIGTTVSIIHILYASFVLLMPFCILTGFLFTLFCEHVSAEYRINLISKVYSLESIGSILGGVLFNFILIYFLNTFEHLTFLMILNLAAAFVMALKTKYLKMAIAFVAVILVPLVIYIDLDKVTSDILFKNQDVKFEKQTPYGNLVLTEDNGQINFYENSVVLFSSNAKDVIGKEETVHYAMVQHQAPENVLLVSGGINGVTKEILKYDIERVDYVEINPWIIKIGKKYTDALENDKIHVFTEDARLFVRSTKRKYDVALINLPDPSTTNINRFYTIEFFNELKQKLTGDAVISLSLSANANYISDEAIKTNSILYNTLNQVFENILIIPGDKIYFLASDNNLTLNVPEKINEKRIPTEYVNRYYLDIQQMEKRSQYITKQIDHNVALNRDFKPISYYRQLMYWLSQFKYNYWAICIILVLLIIFIIRRLSAINLGIFTGGFGASSVQVLLLTSFQVIYGYVYHITGIIITIFMFGLAVGANYAHRIFGKSSIKNYIKLQVFVGIYAILLPLLLILMDRYLKNTFFVHSIFFILSFIIALLVGSEFAVATKLREQRISAIAGDMYSVDLLGSAIGAWLTTAFLIPLLGIAKISIILGILNFFSALVIFIKRKKYYT